MSLDTTLPFAAVAVFALGCARIEDEAGVVTGDAETRCVPDIPLKHRPEGEPVTLVDGMFDPGTATDTNWPLLRQGHYATVRGQGYLSMRWQIEYEAKAGLITPPTFTVRSGTFLHAGGGGGENLGDPMPGTTGTYMGNDEDGLSTMPDGVETPWHTEFYYLDGEVTITIQETDGLYNLTISPKTYDDVVTPGSGIYDPGVVCDPE
jgi:hypothetical protein